MKITPWILSRYIEGELNTEDQKFIEENVTRGEIIRFASVYREIHEAILKDEEIKIIKFLLEKRNDSKKRLFVKYFSSRKVNYLVAAAILFLILPLTIYFVTDQKNIVGKDIYSEFYSPFERNGIVRSKHSSTFDPIFEKGVRYYNQGDYKAATICFDSLLQVNNKNNLSRLYAAICNIEQDSIHVAIIQLKTLLSSDDILYHDLALWYLSLVYIKQERYDLARKHLKAIQFYKRKEVKDILSLIE
jgi:tetratricopeptide (TPR) repeat protein